MDFLGQQLQEFATELQEFSMVGLRTKTPPLDTLVESLCSITTLSSVTLKANPVPVKTLLAPSSLKRLLTHVTQQLNLSGVFPEEDDYQRILLRAYVTEKATTHIYLHFAGTALPSPFCYFLRHAMEVNQIQQQQQQQQQQERALSTTSSSKKRFWHRPSSQSLSTVSSSSSSSSLSSSQQVVAEGDGRRMQDLLQFLAKRKYHSPDAAYWMIRENPWLCRQAGAAPRNSKPALFSFRRNTQQSKNR